MQVKLNRVIGAYLQVHMVPFSNTDFGRVHIITVDREGVRPLLRLIRLDRFGSGRLLRTQEKNNMTSKMRVTNTTTKFLITALLKLYSPPRLGKVFR